MFCSCKNFDFNDAVKQSTSRIHIGSKIVDNVELSSSIITWHKMVANKWSNTIKLCNCRSFNSDDGCTLVEGATLEIGAILAEGATLEIGEWCTQRRLNSEDWCNTEDC